MLATIEIKPVVDNGVIGASQQAIMAIPIA
jgi:hypothetical protein